MRLLIALGLAALICGCICSQDKPLMQYTCPQGQVVSNESECYPTTSATSAEPATSTLEVPSTTIPETTTTLGVSQTTATYPHQDAPTTTTLCSEQAVRGYLLVNDKDEGCHLGYTYRLDAGKWNCTDKGLCRIGLVVKKPSGQNVSVQARPNLDGSVTFAVDGMDAEMLCTREDTVAGLFTGVVKFS
jgi:hypothetical protein